MSSIYFKATNEQLKTLIANAYNASIPVGMGMIQYREGDIKPEDVILPSTKEIYVDYMQGRMVKLMLRMFGEYWRTENDVRPGYQSWAIKYPAAADLLKASGITEFHIEGDEDAVPEPQN